MRIRHLVVAIVVLPFGLVAQSPQPVNDVLPATATAQLATSFEAARAHARHVWRDTPPRHADGTVNASIEIARGDRRKRETR